MITYPIGSSGQRIIFSERALEHFHKHRQNRPWKKEAGGQLFARIDLPDILIEEATGPRRADLRSRNSYRPDRRAEQREILERLGQGLHFVGDWHTHPEPYPNHSLQDVASMRELVTKSQHRLNGFLLVIVGNVSATHSLFVSVVDAESLFVLDPLL